MQPSNRNEYRKLCAVLHDFHEERFWASDYIEPSRADHFQPTPQAHLVGAAPVVYGGSSTGLMDYWLRRHFPLLVEDWGADRLPRPPFPLVKNVVASKAVAFREQVNVNLVEEATGTTITADVLPIAGTLTRRLQETGWFRVMRQKETMAVLYRTAASHYKIADGEMVITALAPFAFDIEPWAADPSDPSRARSISAPAGGMAYVPEPEKEPRYFYERIPGTPPTWRAALVDEKGQPMAALPEAPDGQLITGRYPVVVWKEGESAGPYAAPPQALYSAQVNVLLELINSTVAVRGGAHANVAVSKQAQTAGDILRTSGTDPLADGGDASKGDETIRFPTGVQSIFRVPDGYEASILQSRVDPEKYAKWVQALIKLAYIAESMAPGSVDLINPPPSNVSGKARLQEQMPRLLAKSRRESQLREMALEDLKTWAAYWNLLAPESERIPEGVTFRIQFSEILSPDALADQSTVQSLEAAAGMGLVDLIKMRQQIDQSSYEEAKAAYWKSAGNYKRVKAPLPDVPPAA